ncbi:uncharacterized protein LOC109722571 [Ananas comosus]|uniref:Uncharacterized protein LOC109722571 n=1 Tax=Ananas comosus TaxID=4615 RepID=A0A6P5GJL4_ANACO|nr:uncharacterized protein LOC109722571 [Ananas comosus]
MALVYDSIRDITPLEDKWKIKVRVICLYTLPEFHRPEGDRIHATVRKAFLNKFKGLFMEEKVYVINQFGVGQSSGSYRTTIHPYKINFQYSTVIHEMEDVLTISKYGFIFTPFDEILANVADDKYLVDVIGKLSGISRIEESCKDVFFSVKLIATRNWVAHCGKGSRSISNSLYAPKMMINTDISEILEFKNKIVSGELSQSMVLSEISTQSTFSLTDDFLKVSQKKTLAKIQECQQPCVCVTLATVLSVETERCWYYNSCKKCSKKVISDGTGFYCEFCERMLCIDVVVDRLCGIMPHLLKCLSRQSRVRDQRRTL